MLFPQSIYRCEPSATDILTAKAEIKKCIHSISVLEERINALRREQVMLEETIHQCRGVFSIARRIPDELLAAIFEQCATDGWTPAPLVVSQVCSAWRRAAEAPRVWSFIHADLESPKTVGRTRFWLKRAGDAPLTIIISSGWNDQARIDDILDLIIPHAPRWTSLTIKTLPTWSNEAVNNVISRLVHVDMQRLREVDILTGLPLTNVAGLVGKPDIPRLADALSQERSPKLTCLRISTYAIPYVTFPSQLRELTVSIGESPLERPLSAAALLALLANLPQLATLTLSMPQNYNSPYIYASGFDESQIVSLPALTTLTMYGPQDLNGLLEHLLAPSLRAIHLRSLKLPGSIFLLWPSLQIFLTTAGAAIELFELHDTDLGPLAFESAFEQMPNLRELRLHRSAIPDETLALLSARRLEPESHWKGFHEDAWGLCPRLARLDLRWCRYVTGDTLVDIVESRKLRDTDMNTVPDEIVADANFCQIEEVAVTNCSIDYSDVLDLCGLAVCRIGMREDDDYCRSQGCCDNREP